MGTVHLTDKKIGIPQYLWDKLAICIKRCERDKPKSDALITIEGEEGIGKTTLSALVGYIIHYETGRPFSEKNMFFNVSLAVEFAQSTTKQIIIFDEPATDLMSAEWWKDTQKKLIKLLMMARKNRHFLIFNLTKFYKFPEYIVVDRARGMIHVYAKSGSYQPRFVYIKKKYLERLYNDYRYKKQRNYFKYAKMSGKIRGTFPDVFDETKDYNILDCFDINAYEETKTNAIMSIGKDEKKTKETNEVHKLKKKISNLKFPIQTINDFVKLLGMDKSTFHKWKKIEIEDED